MYQIKENEKDREKERERERKIERKREKERERERKKKIPQRMTAQIRRARAIKTSDNDRLFINTKKNMCGV